MLVRGDNPNTTFGVSLGVGSGNSITGGTTALSVTGSATAISGNTLNDLTLTGQSGNYITLSSGVVGADIDATGVTFGSGTGGSRTTAQNYALENSIAQSSMRRTSASFAWPQARLSSRPRANRPPPARFNGRSTRPAAARCTFRADRTRVRSTRPPASTSPIDPGDSAGQITNSGSLAVDSGDALKIELGGTAAATNYDNFVLTGGSDTVSLGGATLNLSLINPFTPSAGDRFTIINNGGNSAVTDLSPTCPKEPSPASAAICSRSAIRAATATMSC